MRTPPGPTPLQPSTAPLPAPGAGVSLGPRGYRWLLACYWPLVLAITHWPNLAPTPPALEGLELDKIVHFSMFVVLAYLLVRARLAGRRAGMMAHLAVGALIAAAYAGVDEYTQRWIPGRTVSLLDAIANWLAVASVALAVGVSDSRHRGATVLAWVCRAGLCLLLPYLALTAFGHKLRLENLLVEIAPALHWKVQGDKLAHVAGAMLLSWLFYGAQFTGTGRRQRWLNFLVMLLLVAPAGPLVEIIQYYVGRDYELADMAAHEIGLGLGVVIICAGWIMLALSQPRKKAPAAITALAESAPAGVEVEAGATAPTTTDDAVTAVPSATATAAGAAPTSAPTTTTATNTAAPGETKPARATSGHFVGAAMVVSALTFLSRITGLGRDVYLAGALGLSAVSDAFWFGFQIPNLFRRLFGEGALTAAFIPVYTQALERDRILARRFASLCIAITLIVLGALTLLGEAVLAGVWARGALSPDWALAVKLTMVMLPYMPLVCLVALFGSILQVHGKFAPAAGMPIFLNVVMIVGTWVALHSFGGHDDTAMRRVVTVIGLVVVLAGVVQLVTQLILMLKHESLTLVFAGARPCWRAFAGTFIPSFLALSVFQLNTFLDAMIAMTLSPKDGLHPDEKLHILQWVVDYPIRQGGLAALNNAQRLYQFPLGVFGVSIATAIFPALSKAAAEPGLVGAAHFRRILQAGLRLTVFIGLPASVGLIVTSLPLVRVLFERHAFTTEDSWRVTWVLIGYAPAIWAYSMAQVLTRAFYAVRDARTPMTLSLLMVGMNLVLNLTFVWALGAAGLAWATAICAIVQVVMMLSLIRGAIDVPVDRTVWVSWGKSAVLSLVMAAALVPIEVLYPPLALTKAQVTVELAAMLALGLVLYLGGAWVLHCPEMDLLRRRRAE